MSTSTWGMIHTAVQYGAHVTPEDVVRLVGENGGATISNDWRIAGGGWLVGIDGFSVVLPELEARAIHSYMDSHHPAFMGLWRNPETGNVFLDTIQVVEDKQAAIEIGIANNQLAIYNDLTHEEEDLRNWYPNIGLASVRTAGGPSERLGELGSYTLQVQRARGWAASTPLLEAPDDENWNWVALSSVRLGASVEENATATIEELLGLSDKGGHKPARPDIQKLRDSYELASRMTSSYDWSDEPGGKPAPDQIMHAQQTAKRRWEDKTALNTLEQETLGYYLQLLHDGWEQGKAFDQIAYALTQGGNGFVGHEQDAKRFLGNALKKYEEQFAPRLYQTIERALNDAYRRNTSSYKLWPWMVKQIKERFKDWLFVGRSVREGFNPDYSRMNAIPPILSEVNLPHILDIVTEGGEILSKLRAENKIPQNFDVNKLDFSEFEDWLMAWKRENRESESQGQVVYEFHDGWTIQKLETPESLQFEGDEMNHCVGSYSYQVLGGGTIIYSLRDEKGMPHATMEVTAIEGDFDGENPETEYIHPDRDLPHDNPVDDKVFEIEQIMGKGNNSPKPEYQRKIKEFLDALRAKGWKFVRSDSYHNPWDEGDDDGWYNLSDHTGYSGNRDYAQALNTWYDDHYKPNHEAYRGQTLDAYGLIQTRNRLNVEEWQELFEHCLGSLIDDYDPGRFRGRWNDLAQAVWHAWNLDESAKNSTPETRDRDKKNFLSQIQAGEDKIEEWENEQWYYAYPQVKDQIAENIQEFAEQQGTWVAIEQALDKDPGEGMWDEDELIDYVQTNDDGLYYEATDSVREEAQKYYSGDAWKFCQYLYMLAEKNGMASPQEVPNPNDRHGGLPSFEDLEKMPWPEQQQQQEIETKTPVEKGIPGTLSKVKAEWHEASQPVDIQIHPIDEEHNVYFDEDGNQRPRWRPTWVKNEVGKMEQTGPVEDSFLDKQGRQGQGYIAYHGDRPIGSLTFVDEGLWQMLGTAYTHPDYRQQGVFNKLVAPLRESGKPISAFVWNNPWLKAKVHSWPENQ